MNTVSLYSEKLKKWRTNRVPFVFGSTWCTFQKIRDVVYLHREREAVLYFSVTLFLTIPVPLLSLL